MQMRKLAITIVFLSMLVSAQCQTFGHPTGVKKELRDISWDAFTEHEKGNFDNELALRLEYSDLAWKELEQNPKNFNDIDRWSIFSENETPFAFLLEGKHRWEEAEKVYRRTRQHLEHERAAGNDVKSKNELALAHLLSSEGKQDEAAKICQYWENKVKHNADFALSAMKNNVPTPPLYDTSQVEIGHWDLECGKPTEGEDLLRTQILAHPHMLASYNALIDFYIQTGEYTKAIDIQWQWNMASKPDKK